MSERRSVEFPTYHYTSVTDPQTGKQKPYMPTEMLADFAIPPAGSDVEAAWGALTSDLASAQAETGSGRYTPALHPRKIVGGHRTAIEAAIRAEYESSLQEAGRVVSEALAAKARAESGRLDVERLARAFDINGISWPKRWGANDFAWLARQVAAEYARLTEDAHKP